MQWIFSIHKEDEPEIARIIYDWENDKFSGLLRKNTPVDLFHLPWEWVEHIRNEKSYTLNDAQCRQWISYRVVPATRHNIGSFLRRMGVAYYHECFMMRYMPRTHSDSFLTDFISGEDIGLYSYN